MSYVHGIIFSGFTITRFTAMPGAGAYRLRTYLEQHGYPIEVVDYFEHWSTEELIQIIEKLYNPNMKFIGFSVTFMLFNNSTLLNIIKKRWPTLHIVIGSPEPLRSRYVDTTAIRKNIDMLFYGHAENALLEYIKFLDGKVNTFIHETFDNGLKYVVSKDTYPYTDTNDLSIIWKKDDPVSLVKALPIELSRGCIFKCKFCSYPLIGKKSMDYIRDSDNLADEFKRNYDEFGINIYVFADDTFNDSNFKLEMVRKAIAKSGINISFSAYIRYDLLHRNQEQINILCEMGMHTAVLGIESLNERSRKIVGKGLTNDQVFYTLEKLKSTKKDLWVNNNFIVGLPGETIEDLLSTQTWVREQNFKYLDSWHFEKLWIRQKSVSLISEFEKEPEKYGYNVISNTEWECATMNSTTAQMLADDFNKERDLIARPVGFNITSLLSLGYEANDLIGKKFKDIKTLPIARKIIATYINSRLTQRKSI